MTKYNEYKLKAQKFEKLLTALGTHGAIAIDLSPKQRVRFVTNGGGEKVIWTEKYVDGQGWVAEN